MGQRMLENAVASGRVRSSLVKSDPTAKRGMRLIEIASIDAWIEEYVGGKADLPYLKNRRSEVANPA